jgi:hypothetical protein
LALLAVGAGLAAYFIFGRQQASATNTTSKINNDYDLFINQCSIASSTINSANTTSSTTAGSSNLNVNTN